MILGCALFPKSRQIFQRVRYVSVNQAAADSFVIRFTH